MLAKEGYCYPTFPFEYPGISKAHNGRFLMGVVKDKDGNRNTKQEEINFREGMNIVKKLFREYEHIILSDEGIWRRRGFLENYSTGSRKSRISDSCYCISAEAG
jgi:hypothetical protein